MRITVRRLDVEPRIERRIAKRQFLRVALPKRQPLDPMPLPAKRDAGGIQIEPGGARRAQRARQPRRPAAVAAAHLQHGFPPQVRLRRDVVIKLDARAVGLVGGLEREPARRIVLEGLVEKQHLVGAQATREKGIPKRPNRPADEPGREQVVNQRHRPCVMARPTGVRRKIRRTAGIGRPPPQSSADRRRPPGAPRHPPTKKPGRSRARALARGGFRGAVALTSSARRARSTRGSPRRATARRRRTPPSSRSS